MLLATGQVGYDPGQCLRRSYEQRKVRVGIIGAGGWANTGISRALQSLKDDFEIVAISSRKKETAEEYAAKFNIQHAFDDPQALIDSPDVDFVAVLVPAHEHARLAKPRLR
jgi:predicted dehydrogenase